MVNDTLPAPGDSRRKERHSIQVKFSGPIRTFKAPLSIHRAFITEEVTNN